METDDDDDEASEPPARPARQAATGTNERAGFPATTAVVAAEAASPAEAVAAAALLKNEEEMKFRASWNLEETAYQPNPAQARASGGLLPVKKHHYTRRERGEGRGEGRVAFFEQRQRARKLTLYLNPLSPLYLSPSFASFRILCFALSEECINLLFRLFRLFCRLSAATGGGGGNFFRDGGAVSISSGVVSVVIVAAALSLLKMARVALNFDSHFCELSRPFFVNARSPSTTSLFYGYAYASPMRTNYATRRIVTPFTGSFCG